MTHDLATLHKTALDYLYLLNYSTVLNVILTSVDSKTRVIRRDISFRSIPVEPQVCLHENAFEKRLVR